MSERSMTVECRLCGFKSSTKADVSVGAMAMLDRLDVAHDALNPDCPDAVKRAAAVTP